MTPDKGPWSRMKWDTTVAGNRIFFFFSLYSERESSSYRNDSGHAYLSSKTQGERSGSSIVTSKPKYYRLINETLS